MNSIGKIIKTVMISSIFVILTLMIMLNSSRFLYNMIGIIIIIMIEIMAARSILEELKHDLPDSEEKREEIIERFAKTYNIRMDYNDITTIVEASYYSGEWEHELYAMTNNYANLGMWYKADDGKMSWLRVYLSAFPVKEITSDMDEQYNIVVDKHLKNLVMEINKKDFLTNEEIIKYINDTFYLTFDKNSFAIFKAFMKNNDSYIALKNEGQIGFDTEYTKLIREYSSSENKLV